SNWHKEYALVKDEKFDTLLGPQVIFLHQQRRTYEEHKAELEEENYHLRSEIQIEVDTNRQNEKQIRDLERDYDRCVQEIQTLNGKIERLENASKEEIIELKSEISSLKSRLYQAKKD
ncbi:3500_t:CDS:2, partial [Funneliformis geosporum]